jgi:hydrogenase/urease accessory protein HupE
MTLLRLLLVLLTLSVTAHATADEFRPAYLQLRQVDAATYDVLWKIPAVDEFTTLKVNPEFPAGVSDVTAKRSSYADGIAVQRWRIHATGGLNGKPIAFSNLSMTRIDVLVRVARSDGTVQLERVMPLSPSFVVAASPGPLEVVRTYTLLGIEHILTGFDHLLFVLALVLLVRRLKPLLQTVTAFTLAHSITLALATVGVVHVPGALVEATIALSIVFVAVEIVQQQRGREGLTSRKPWLVAFSFGLLHGLGFAGALAQIGLPQNAIPLALLFFNLGVEIGQVMFVAAVLAVMAAGRRLLASRLDLSHASIAAAYVIGGLSTFWMFERVAEFWG